MAAEGLDTEPEPGAVCCYALQDKVWAHDPDGMPVSITPSWSTSRHHDPGATAAVPPRR